MSSAAENLATYLMSSAENLGTATTERPECLPACHCVPSTTWASRTYDGTWDEDPGGGVLEQRTCRVCSASFTREVQR